MNNKKKWATIKIVKLIFIIIFAISTIAFCFMPLGFDIKDDTLEQIFIAGMFADITLWIISLFGFFTCLLLSEIKKNNPEKYAKLFPSSEDANFFKKIWESPLILIILTVVLLIVGEIVCVALDDIIFTVSYLVIEAICIILGLIFKKEKYDISKTLFFSVVIGIIISTIFILLFMFYPFDRNDPCKYCGGKGYFGADGYSPYVDCPDC